MRYTYHSFPTPRLYAPTKTFPSFMLVFYTFVFSVYQNMYIFLAYLNADFRLHKNLRD